MVKGEAIRNDFLLEDRNVYKNGIIAKQMPQSTVECFSFRFEGCGKVFNQRKQLSRIR